MFYEKVIPRNFAKLTGKHLCQSLFFNKVAAFRSLNSIIKQYCSCCIRLIRIDTILSKYIQNNFQNLLFKKLLAQLGDQTDIFCNFYLPVDTFGCTKASGECQVTPLPWGMLLFSCSVCLIILKSLIKLCKSFSFSSCICLLLFLHQFEWLCYHLQR